MPKNAPPTKPFRFLLEITNVFRDFSQGFYGNGIPLDHPIALKMFKLWDELVQSSSGLIKFGPIEIGGAHPQVTAEFKNADYMEAYRKLRLVAPHTPLRPLWRGANGFLLVPSNKADLRHLLTNLAEDVADADLSPAEKAELLRVKIFDSQGIMSEVQSSVDILAELYAKGHPVTAEIAIPYSYDGDIYPDELYVQKAIEAAEMLQKSGLPLQACRISLKDMAGEMSAQAARTLLPKIIHELRARNLNIPLGLHLHDTGLATRAYAAAIKTCMDADYPLTIDTVDCESYDPAYKDENAWRNTGFANTLEIYKILQTEEGVDLGLRDDQIGKLSEIAKLANELAHSHSLIRAHSALSGEELRKFHIPGGAFASFSNAVAGMELAKTLELDGKSALKLAGHALIAVAELMGHPFAVTPGFQNKQIAAINLLKNMIAAGKLKPGTSYEELKKIVLTPLTNEEVRDLFLKNLSPAVTEFLRGEMPAETIARLKPTHAKIHPVIRAAVGRRTEPLTSSVPSKLPAAQAIVTELLEAGQIKATHTQAEIILKKLRLTDERFKYLSDQQIAELLHKLSSPLEELNGHSVTYASPDGSCEPWENSALYIVYQFFYPHHDEYIAEDRAGEQAIAIVQALKDKALQTNTTWALELGEPIKLKDAIEKYWWRIPNPEDKENYPEALRKYQAGLNPNPSELERLHKELKGDKLPLPIVNEYRQLILAKEYADIRVSVAEFVASHPEDISAVLSGSKPAIEKTIKELYAEQHQISQHKKRRGEKFICNEEHRRDVALDCLKSELVYFSKNAEHLRELVSTQQIEIANTMAIAPMDGMILDVYLDCSNGPVFVEKDQVIAKMEFMKMETTIVAPVDGYIEQVHIKKGAMVTANQRIASYQKKESMRSEPAPYPNQMINVNMAQSRLSTLKQQAEDLNIAITEKKHEISSIPLMKHLQKCGFNGPQLSLKQVARMGHENEIHVIDNRAGCAAKLYADLKQAGYDVRILYTKGDASTPIITNALPGEAIFVNSYTDQQEIIHTLKHQAQLHPDKKIYLHPGWGFLSENDDFAKEVEALPAQGFNIEFVGPPSEAMRIAGGKLTFRDLVQASAPECNPRYFGQHVFTAAALKSYIDSGFTSNLNNIDTLYRAYFENVIAMGGDVMIKAIAGGGGRGIKSFKYNNDVSREENYRRYVTAVQGNVELSERYFKNGAMLTEQCVRGPTPLKGPRHLEVQFGTTGAGSLIFGLRDCTAQNNGQKIIETNVIAGDYSPELIRKIMLASQKVADQLAKIGYLGVGTLEMLILPDETVTFLEVNTRIQVEHMVTEDDVREKTGKNISMPLVNLLFKKNPTISPDKIVSDHFGLNSQDLMKMKMPGEKRITHLRLNSREINPVTGKSLPRKFYDTMMYAGEAIMNIYNQFKARIVIGGLGAAEYDPQVGAISGPEERTIATADQISELVTTSRALTGEDGTLSIDFVREFYKLMYNEKGRFSPYINIKTVDEFLQDIADKKIALEVDLQNPGVSVQLKQGAIQKAFEKFIDLHATPEEKAKMQPVFRVAAAAL